MDTSIFTDRSQPPQPADLAAALGTRHQLWQDICELALNKYPKAVSEWYYPGAKWGWNFRIKDKKRAIVYLLPRDGSFMAAFVFGEKACKKIVESTVAQQIKDDLQAARPYAEGRGIRIDIKEQKQLKDIGHLIECKLST